MKKIRKIILAAVMTGICLLGAATDTQAAVYEGINLEDGKDCTVEITLVDEDTYNQTAPVYVDGAELSIIKVADLNSDGTYTLTSDFQGLDGWDDYVSGSGTASDAQKAADAAQEIVNNNNLAALSTQTTGTDGKAVMQISGSSDGYGVYLLYESGQSTGSQAVQYENVKPVLVSLPQLKDGEWIFNQVLQPKMVARIGTTIKIRKRAQQDGQITDTAVIGAELEIVSADDESMVLDQWTTSTVDHDSVLLQPGKYILKETKVPDGYQQADPISFEITDDGTLLLDNQTSDEMEIVMPDPVNPPAVPSEPENPSVVDKITNMVKTGDTAQIALWAIMAAAAVCVIAGLAVRRKKQKKAD